MNQIADLQAKSTNYINNIRPLLRKYRLLLALLCLGLILCLSLVIYVFKENLAEDDVQIQATNIIFSGAKTLEASPILEILNSNNRDELGYVINKSGNIEYFDWSWGYDDLLESNEENPNNQVHNLKPVVDADKDSFKVFISTLDSTLKPHQTPFAYDKDNFYMFGTVVPELNPAEVKLIQIDDFKYGAVYFAIDTDTVYFLGGYGLEVSLQTAKPGVVINADPSTFKVLAIDWLSSFYAVDNNSVYWNTHRIDNFSPEDVIWQKQASSSNSYEFLVNGKTGEKYYFGKPLDQYKPTSDVGLPVSKPALSRLSPQFAYMSEKTGYKKSEFRTSNGQYVIRTDEGEGRSGVNIYNGYTNELHAVAELKPELAGYDLLFTSPDENYVYLISGFYEFENFSKLYRVELATGKTSEVNEVRSMNTYISLPNSTGLSQNGSKFVFAESSSVVVPDCIWEDPLYDIVLELDTQTGEVRELFRVSPDSSISELTWLPDESGLIYAVERAIVTDDYVDDAAQDCSREDKTEIMCWYVEEPNVPNIMSAYVNTCHFGLASRIGIEKAYYQFNF